MELYNFEHVLSSSEVVGHIEKQRVGIFKWFIGITYHILENCGKILRQRLLLWALMNQDISDAW